jgi:hypothetical protein
VSTPGGKTSLHTWTKKAADCGVCSDGLSKAALPHSTAGKTFHA